MGTVYLSEDGQIASNQDLWRKFEETGKPLKFSEWVDAQGYKKVSDDLREYLTERVRSLRIENGELERQITIEKIQARKQIEQAKRTIDWLRVLAEDLMERSGIHLNYGKERIDPR